MMPALLVIGLLSGWPDVETARAAAEQVTAAEGLQRELPAGKTARPPTPPQFNPPPSRRSSGPRQSAPPARGGSGLGEAVLWVLGGLLVIGFLAVLINERRDRPTRPARSRAADAPEMPVLERQIIDDAERLAAEGRFAEAVHALLLRTIDALSRQDAVPRALTSREILARSRLPEAARGALSDLVAAVEVTRFGGRPADATDYARCVGCFDRIRDALARA